MQTLPLQVGGEGQRQRRPRQAGDARQRQRQTLHLRVGGATQHRRLRVGNGMPHQHPRVGGATQHQHPRAGDATQHQHPRAGDVTPHPHLQPGDVNLNLHPLPDDDQYQFYQQSCELQRLAMGYVDKEIRLIRGNRSRLTRTQFHSTQGFQNILPYTLYYHFNLPLSLVYDRDSQPSFVPLINPRDLFIFLILAYIRIFSI
ncbi:hypothetical protein BDZ97DRAFT_780225 [Flammula alnicola]|nr:hypothetical protein BDZ97DRAFT_780225 [Flammula alnicola]